MTTFDAHGASAASSSRTFAMPTPTWIPEAIRFSQDDESGVEIEQLTSDAVTSTNIYCEQRYTSADGSRIAINRKPFGQPNQLWVCDLRTFRLCYIAEGTVLGSSHQRNALYYRTTSNQSDLLIRLDLADLTREEVLCFPSACVPSGGTISPDEKWLIGGPFATGRDEMYQLYLFNLATGSHETLCEVQDMYNPHAQFDLSGAARSIIQINRAPHRTVAGVSGAPGATLAVCDLETRRVAPLPVGRPWTPRISGHECWVGSRGRLIFTAGQYHTSPTSYVTLGSPPATDTPEAACPPVAIYSIAPGEKAPTVVAHGLMFNHLSASDDGQFFIGDDHATGTIYIGSIDTGRYLPLCQSHTRQGACQYSHVHPYMTPDQQYVIFNSIVTGVAQVYAARIPPDFLAKLQSLPPEEPHRADYAS